MKSFHHYDIAFRRKGEEKFKIVKPPSYGWIADPFLVEFKGELYLFAEIFLYLSERNGVIGYSKFDGEKFGDWIVTMDRHWHLSYPNVFVEKGELYMVPESYQLREVVLYKLIDFPDKWKKMHSYISDVEYVDTTFLKENDGKEYMITFELEEPFPNGTAWIYEVKNNHLQNKRLISKNLEGARCGGKIIKKEDKCIRVAQNCTREYGGGLLFYEIDEVDPIYREHEIYRIDPEDVIGDFKRKYTGIHTFNSLGDIEVIDLSYVSSTVEENEASDRVHKVFVDKYRC